MPCDGLWRLWVSEIAGGNIRPHEHLSSSNCFDETCVQQKGRKKTTITNLNFCALLRKARFGWFASL